MLQCIAKGKDLQKTSRLPAIFEMAVESKNFLQVKKLNVIEFNYDFQCSVRYNGDTARHEMLYVACATCSHNQEHICSHK